MNRCQDCGCRTKDKFCDRCLATWYLENEVSEDTPSGDFDEGCACGGGGCFKCESDQ